MITKLKPVSGFSEIEEYVSENLEEWRQYSSGPSRQQYDGDPYQACAQSQRQGRYKPGDKGVVGWNFS
jgi:hypothetical protein